MLILILLLIKTSKSVPQCSAFLVALDCVRTGYCRWDSTQGCVKQDCYYITNSLGCDGECKPCENIPYLQNICMHISDSILPPVWYTFYPDFEGGIGIEETSVINYSYDQLSEYIFYFMNQQGVQPYYYERLIYESLQNIRDNQLYSDKQTLLEMVWGVIYKYADVIQSFDQYRIANYGIINFATARCDTQVITIPGFKQQFTLTWTWPQNSAIGQAVQVMTYSAKQFGIIGLYSDVFEYSFSQTVTNIKLYWSWDADYPDAPQSQERIFYIIDKLFYFSSQYQVSLYGSPNTIWTNLGPQQSAIAFGPGQLKQNCNGRTYTMKRLFGCQL